MSDVLGYALGFFLVNAIVVLWVWGRYRWERRRHLHTPHHREICRWAGCPYDFP